MYLANSHIVLGLKLGTRFGKQLHGLQMAGEGGNDQWSQAILRHNWASIITTLRVRWGSLHLVTRLQTGLRIDEQSDHVRMSVVSSQIKR